MPAAVTWTRFASVFHVACRTAAVRTSKTARGVILHGPLQGVGDSSSKPACRFKGLHPNSRPRRAFDPERTFGYPFGRKRLLAVDVPEVRHGSNQGDPAETI